jgi:hypothetical protein
VGAKPRIVKEANLSIARAASCALSAVLAFGAAPGVARSSPAVEATASPVPEPPLSPLREIGHVRATTDFCKAALAVVDSAIADLTDNDARAGAAKNILSGSDFDASVLSRAKAEAALQTQYAALQSASKHGIDTLRQMHASAGDAPSKTQQSALDAFSAGLTAALKRQGALAQEVAGMGVVIANRPRIDAQTHDALVRDQLEAEHHSDSGELSNSNSEQAHDDDEADRMVTNTEQRDQRGASGYRDPQGAEHNVMASASEIAQADATIVGTLERGVLESEQTAADRMDAAFSGC